MTISIPSGRVIPIRAKTGGNFESDYDPPAGGIEALSIWDFAAGDTLSSPSKNQAGMSFDDLSFTIATSPQGKSGLRFRFGPDASLGDSWQELRYRYNGAYDEIYEKIVMYVPTNFEHRVVSAMTFTGSVTNWVIGDEIQNSAGDQAHYHGVNGGTLYLKNAENRGSSSWDSGTITNVTRTENVTSTGLTNETYNNKFWFHWEGSYSSNGMGLEFWPLVQNYPADCLSDPRVNATNTDTHVKGPNEPSEAIAGVPIFDLNNLGQEFEYAIHVKHASAAGVEDGVCEVWRDGSLIYANYTMRLFDSVNNHFTFGYLMGWSNSGYTEQTDIFITKYEFFADVKPAGLE